MVATLPLPESLREFLFKYPSRVFEQGVFVWQGAGWARVVVPVVAVLIGLAAWSYFRAGRAKVLDRVVLTCLRAAAIGLLGVCLLRPALLVSISAPQQNVLGILLDDSKSMLIRDADSLTRLERVRQLFGDSTGSLVRKLSERYALRFYRFSETMERIDRASGLRGVGGRTDLAGALTEVRRDFAGTSLAGLIVATDGADNGGQSMSDPLLSLQAAKIPVYTVGIGQERFARDVSVERVELPRSTLKGAVLLGSVALRVRGVAGETVSLTVEDNGKIVATRDVTVPKGTESITIPIRIPPLESGVRPIRVQVRPLRGEAVSQNNSRDAQVRVRDRREKILYLEGDLRPEFPFLRRAAAADSNLQVVGLQRTSKGKFLRLGVDDSLELVKGFPTTRSELFQYRALILGTIEASFFTADQLRMIAEFVSERGGGLLALGGRESFGEGAFQGTAVADVLPVGFANRTADSSEAAVELTVVPTAVGLGNAALILTDREETNPAHWDSLPPLTSVNRLGGLKPGATLLLEGRLPKGGGTVPVLAQQRFGRGRALMLGVQDTWLWQMHAAIAVEDQTHETLWRQLLRWVLEDVPDRLEVTMSPEHPVPGQRVTVRAEFADSNFLRVNDASLVAQITTPDNATTVLPLDWGLAQDGVYRGSFVASAEGNYRIAVTGTRGRDSVMAEPDFLDVADRGADFLNAEMRAPLLQRIATETGGKFYTAATVSQLPDDVLYTESGVTVKETKDLWDMPVIFFGLIALLGTEWIYRRRRGLV